MISRRKLSFASAAVLISGRAFTSAPRQKLMVFGDSISAGFGLAPDEGWVFMMSSRLQAYGVEVVNASRTGETTKAAIEHLPGDLERHHPTHMLIELGVNDALRGLSLAEAKTNLITMINQARSKGVAVGFVGMKSGTAIGRATPEEQARMFQEVVSVTGIPSIPYLLEGFGLRPGAEKYLQKDRLHPNSLAQPMMLDNVWPLVRSLLGI